MTAERITHWIGVPTMYWTLLKYAREQGIDVSRAAATLRLAVSGGAPMPVELMRDFEKTFGVRIIEGYGLSETSPVASFNHLDRPSKPGTVGQPLFAVDIMIVDDKDEPVETGQPGEVVIRGHNVMKGYYKQPEATAEAMRNGWFHTGDIGTLDADGYLSIVDRKKDMILRGGFNVYPRELEEVMLTHPAVSLVAVVGVPDERLGEEVKAFVVKKPGAEVTEDALRAWCKEQFAGLQVSAPHRVPHRAADERHGKDPQEGVARPIGCGHPRNRTSRRIFAGGRSRRRAGRAIGRDDRARPRRRSPRTRRPGLRLCRRARRLDSHQQPRRSQGEEHPRVALRRAEAACRAHRRGSGYRPCRRQGGGVGIRRA